MMKTVRVLFGIAIVALLAVMFLFSPKARADGMHGVRETATEILVEVPKFCRPLKTVWEVRWEENAINKEAVLSLMRARDQQSIKLLSNPGQTGFLRVQTVWGGAEIVHIPKVDAKGNLIKIKRLSIAGMGDEMGDFSQDNWIFILDRGIPKNISPPVRVGTWGKCK